MNACRCCGSADEAIILHISIAITRGYVMLFLIVIYSNFWFVSPGLRLGKSPVCTTIYTANVRAILERYISSVVILFPVEVNIFCFCPNQTLSCTIKETEIRICTVDSWST